MNTEEMNAGEFGTEERLSAPAIRGRLNGLLAERAQINRALKRRLRATWTEPMADVQREHARSRRRTTELFVAKAYLRGRRHLERPPRDGAYPGMRWDAGSYHRSVAERVMASLGVTVTSRALDRLERYLEEQRGAA